MRTVELIGDDQLERAVRAAWRRLDQAGFSSLGQHRHPTNRPHLTLASADDFPATAATAVAQALGALPIVVRLDGLRFFGGRSGVLAWAVDGGEALRDLQAEVWAALDGGDRNPQHEPDVWTPHVSLARRVRPDQVVRATEAVGVDVVRGELSAARSYDSLTRTVIPLP
jgi:2'-5' RNA ligase